MRRDAHLYSCPEPLQLSGSLEGLCGKEVKEPVIVKVWDGIEVGQKLNTSELIGICAILEQRYATKEATEGEI